MFTQYSTVASESGGPFHLFDIAANRRSRTEEAIRQMSRPQRTKSEEYSSKTETGDTLVPSSPSNAIA
eukprot:7380035-Prymnesium_polylepis.1